MVQSIVQLIRKKDWKALRDKHGYQAGFAKQSIGKKLDDYHKQKTTDAKTSKLKPLKKAVEGYIKALQI